ncbi:MAG: hypothetical protein RMM17_09125 [Acidobacteriota bacterium]|nr:hypothetical protein [Blastocatellia bacterium]MDW8412829.1 hypothetical protein [Acidobacteriota bacterium]
MRSRLRYEAVQKTITPESNICISVTLSYREQIYQSSACGSIDGNEVELAAEACLKAVEQFVQGHFSCQLIEADMLHVLGRPTIVLLVRIPFEGREIEIFGSCKISSNVLEAAARAALDATNRYVELVISK